MRFLDNMIQQPNWPDGQQEKAVDFVKTHGKPLRKQKSLNFVNTQNVIKNGRYFSNTKYSRHFTKCKFVAFKK